VKSTAYDCQRQGPAIGKLKKVCIALFSDRSRDAKALARRRETIPFGSACHGGTLAVDGEIAEREDELPCVGDPGVEQRLLG
jgi:hypothetical protein